jgi:hypothetical protein
VFYLILYLNDIKAKMNYILLMSCYTLVEFQKIEDNFNINELSQTTIKIVNDLAKKVGAPNYSKTPVFKKKITKKYHVNKDDWQQIRNFKTTQLKKNQEGIEAQIDSVRINLNKLTNNNYTVITNEIFNFINNIIDKEENSEKTYNILMRLGSCIFEVGCLNVFWSKLYAKLFHDLINEFNIMKKICKDNLDNFSKIFDKIDCVELNNSNYNDFCNCNKNNENRRGMSSFMVNLMLNDVVSVEYIFIVIKNLLDKINDSSEDVDKINVNEEITENLFILLTSGKEKLKENEKEWEGIIRTIEFYTENSNISGGISKKIQFKCLDIIDEIEE